MKKICFTVFASLYTLLVIGQGEETADVTVNDINDEWYASPWVWVAGAALIIVLLVVLSQKKDSKS